MGADVVATLERVASVYGWPKRIRVDNGPEFISKDLDLWAWLHGVELDFSRPGKPTDNAFAESFNAKFQAEYLNAYWFLSLDDARLKSEAWRKDYNEIRPHSAIGNQTPRICIRSGMPDLMQAQPEDSHSKWSKEGARLNWGADSTSPWRSFRGSGQAQVRSHTGQRARLRSSPQRLRPIPPGSTGFVITFRHALATVGAPVPVRQSGCRLATRGAL
jgi:integrase-like protein